MKKILLIFIFLIGFQFAIAKNYELGDTLNVFAPNGLNLRSDFDTESDVIKKLSFGEKVIIESELLKLDTIDSRIGNWVKVRTIDQETGYVFDPFISKFPIPNEYQIKESLFVEYIQSNFKQTTCEIVFQSPILGEKSQSQVMLVQLENGITAYYTGGWEWQDTEFIFNDIRFGELITLTELFYSRYRFAKEDFRTELSNSFKSSPNEIRIQINGTDVYVILKNGLRTKSIIISESTG